MIAIFCSDLHLSHRAPLARTEEPDWYMAMKRPLDELRALVVEHQCPVIYAGDIFDDGWRVHRCPPELINFALRNLPRGFAVPGQHDLPYHEYGDIMRSAYWTLVTAEILHNLPPNTSIEVPAYYPLRLHGFPWGFEIAPLKQPHDLLIDIAVIHSYIWMEGHSYPDPPKDASITRWSKRLKGYDVAVFGDNHLGFLYNGQLKEEDQLPILNCGTFMRRRSDERDYQPRVGLLYSDGKIKRHKLDVSEDKFLDVKELLTGEGVDEKSIHSFLEDLQTIRESCYDFAQIVTHFVKANKVSKAVKEILLNCLEK